MKKKATRKIKDSEELGLSWEKVAFWGWVAATAFLLITSLLMILSSKRVDEVKQLREEIEFVEYLKIKVDNLGKPGNDLLEHYDRPKESRRLNKYRKDFNTAQTALQKKIAEDAVMLSFLEVLYPIISGLNKQTDAVFNAVALRETALKNGEPDSAVRQYEMEAAAAMARMDRQTNVARSLMGEMSKGLLNAQQMVLARMRRFFYWTCFFSVLSFASFAIGIFLIRRIGRAHHRALVLKKYVSNVIQSIPSGILILSDELVVLSANDAFRKMFGNRDAMLMGKAVEVVLPLSDLKLWGREVVTSGRAHEDIVEKLSVKADWMCAQDGDRWLQVSLVPITGAMIDGDQGRLLLIVGDIGIQKKLEIRTRAILRNAQDGVAVFDDQGVIIWANPAAEGMFGISREALKGQMFVSLIQEKEHERYHQIIQSISESEKKNHGQKARSFQGIRQGGGGFPVEIAISAVKEDAHWIYTAFIRDKTDAEMAEAAINTAYEELDIKQQQLVQSEKMAAIGQLAAGVAHEINNPVGYVKSNLGRMKEYCTDLSQLIRLNDTLLGLLDAGDDAAIQKRAAEIRKMTNEIGTDFILDDLPVLLEESEEGTVRVQNIVKNLKDFSHVDSEESCMFNLNKGIESTLKIVWNELKYDTEIVKEYGEGIEVIGNPNQINQVIMNLLVNASHAIKERIAAASDSSQDTSQPGKGTIWIRTFSDKGYVVLEVKDTGAGIAPESIKKLFDPFFTTKPVGKGTGLGLSISYGIVKKHKGRIEVKSEVGVGTTFRVLLPAMPVDQAISPENARPEEVRVEEVQVEEAQTPKPERQSEGL